MLKCVCVALVASSGGVVLAQSTVHEVTGTPTDALGWYVGRAGDVNQDGIADYLATATGSPALAVQIRSGSDGAILGGIQAGNPGPGVGVSPVGGVDLDGDGWVDILTGSTELGMGLVYSGATLGLVRTHLGLDSGDLFGQGATVLGDLELDGFPDYAFRAGGLGISQPGKKRYVLTFSGATGQSLHTTFGVAKGDYGCGIERLGDITGDGVDEYLVSDPYADIGGGDGSGTSNEGSISLLDGASGAMMLQHWGSPGDHMGCGIVGLEDLDGDQLPDFATTRGPPPGTIAVMSTVSGAKISSMPTPPGVGQWLVTGADDLDKDGARDLLVSLFGVGGQAVSRLSAYSSKSGSLLYESPQPSGEGSVNYVYPWDVVAFGDVDGDGRSEWVVGNPSGGSGLGSIGSVRVISTRSLFNHQSAIEVAHGYRVDIDLNAGVPRAGNQYILLLGATGTLPGVAVNGQVLPVNFDPLTDVSIVLANTGPFHGTLGLLDAYGRASTWFDGSILPPSAIGAKLAFGYYSVGAGGVYLSTNPVELTVK